VKRLYKKANYSRTFCKIKTQIRGKGNSTALRNFVQGFKLIIPNRNPQNNLMCKDEEEIKDPNIKVNIDTSAAYLG
jgi:hypothetical protein